MDTPKVLIHESDGRIARRFRELPKAERQCSLHEPRRFEDCAELLGGPAVFVLRVGGDIESELELLQRIVWRFPETACLVAAEHDDPAVSGLAWDLGARHVVTGPGSIELLPQLAAAFLNKAGGAT